MSNAIIIQYIPDTSIWNQSRKVQQNTTREPLSGRHDNLQSSKQVIVKIKGKDDEYDKNVSSTANKPRKSTWLFIVKQYQLNVMSC